MALFTKHVMAQLLRNLRDHQSNEVVSIVKSALLDRVQLSLMDASVHPVIKKLMDINKNSRGEFGFSIADMVALGNEMEATQLNVTTVQNWVKRDVKELIATPQSGKKYSVEQVATIYIIDDLKSSLDFDAIRKVLNLIFNDPNSDEDDLIHPTDFLAAYTSIFEQVRQQGMSVELVRKEAENYVSHVHIRSMEERNAIESAIVIAVLALQASNYQRMAKTLAESTILTSQLRGMH